MNAEYRKVVICPSLIIQHSKDTLAPLEVGDYLHKELKNSTIKVLNVAGHCGHMSHPKLVIEAMQEYFNTSCLS